MFAARIPVTVIGGFLGAGKTTLVNRLLTQAHGRRLAVLVNDFGAINVDRALIRNADADAIELTNGCVCCQIGDDLSAALIALIESASPPDAILIEASGVSDPWRIAQVAIADPALTLEAVLVMVDVGAIRGHADDPLLADTVLRQLRAADLLIVNHCDRLDDEALRGVDAWLDQVCAGVARHCTRFAQVPAELTGIRPLWCTRHMAVRCACAKSPVADSARTSEASSANRDTALDHGKTFDTWVWTAPPRFDADRLKALLKAMPAGVLRMKGLVTTQRHRLAELQFAGQHGSLRTAPASVLGDVGNACVIVAIGARGRLPVAQLDKALRDAAISADQPIGA